jgi:hypothetical protein
MSISIIWNGGYDMKAQAIMASTTSKADENAVIDMAELGARLAKRRAALGNPDRPRPSLS